MAVDHSHLEDQVYLGIQQSVLGQIGWRLDTRIQGVRVAHVAGYDSWYGGAHAADSLIKAGMWQESLAEVGGKWQVLGEDVENGNISEIPSITPKIAVLNPPSPSGLIHAVTKPTDHSPTNIGLVWRCLDERNHWRLELSERTSRIVCVDQGIQQVLTSRDYTDRKPSLSRRIQVLDDGNRLMAYIDGEPLAEGWIFDTRLNEATKVGTFTDALEQADSSIQFLEAHPRHVRLPEILDMGAPWARKGTRVVVADNFAGERGNMDGRELPVGVGRWTRLIGKGIIEVTGDGAARIRGSVATPCPGRTAYCIDWAQPDFADLEAIIIPPGTKRGQREHCIAGFILYQDSDNYVTLNLWRGDSYGGASISTFFMFDGFEDLYDAIWTNVGNRIYYGHPSRLRLCCDGEQYCVLVDDEPVLYRAFSDVYPNVSRLQIRKIGLIANWEFGTDTGSTFKEFCGRL